MATFEFSIFAGILSEALSWHHLLGSEIVSAGILSSFVGSDASNI